MENLDTHTNSLRDVFNSRLGEFRQSYSFPEQDEAIRALAVTGELLDLMFVREEASVAMTALRAIIANGNRQWDWSKLANVAVDGDWRQTWQDIDGWDASSTPPFLDELHDLHAFAHYGILPIWDQAGDAMLARPEAAHLRDRLAAAQDTPAWVESVCLRIDHLERLVPRESDGGVALSQTLATRNMARARVKLDQGRPITVHDLAALSCVTVKRVQNAIYAKTEEAPLVDRNGLISPEACEPWLTARDYYPSIWKQVAALYPLSGNWGQNDPLEEAEPNRLVDDYLFVPVANDGSMFTPGLKRSGKGHEGGYTVGAKGSEQVIPVFEEALGQLRRMEVPRWRRPNPESGNWGIVTGQTWRRVRPVELEGAPQ